MGGAKGADERMKKRRKRETKGKRREKEKQEMKGGEDEHTLSLHLIQPSQKLRSFTQCSARIMRMVCDFRRAFFERL